MSIDNRVVKMQFDNKQFEENVSKSMTTLDKLEEKLQFKKSSKGLSSLQQGIDSVTFEKLANGIESINNKLSATGIVAAKFVSSIADSIVAGVKKVEQASIGQMKTGGWNRAMNIENAKFAIEGLKGNWEELQKAINYSVSGTAYGFDEAAKAASTFMASGVDYVKAIETKDGEALTMMHKALRGISGVAAQTNSAFSDIANIFTTISGNGRLMADQLNQLSSRGMNAAAILGEQLHMTEAEVREATSKGKISFETFATAMDNAFGDHAKDANKTFTGSLSNMKAALSRFGAVFATPIIQKTNKFFIALTGQINEMKKAISDVTENGKVLEEHLESHFAKMWQNLIDLGSTLVGSIDLTWFKNMADGVDKFVQKLSTALEIMNAFASDSASSTSSVAKTAYDLSKITQGELDMTYKIIRGEFSNGEKRKKELKKYLQENELSYDPEKLQAYVNVMAKVGYIFEKAGIKLVKEGTQENEEYARSQQAINQMYLNIYLAVTNFFKSLTKLRNHAGNLLTAITEPFGGFIGIAMTVSDLLRVLVNGFGALVDAVKPTEGVLRGVSAIGEVLGNAFGELVYGIESAIYTITNFVKAVLNSWKESGELEQVLYDVATAFNDLWTIARNIGTTIARIFTAFATAFFTVFKPSKATGLITAFTGSLASLSESFVLSEDAAATLTKTLTIIFAVVEGIASAIGSVVKTLLRFVGGFKKANRQTEGFVETTEDTAEVIEETGEVIEEATDKVSKLVDTADKIKKFFKDLFDVLSKNEGVIRLKNAFTKLGDAFKGSVKSGVDSLKRSLDDLGDSDKFSITIEDVANAVGWLADKIAWFVENIPNAINGIKTFFISTYNTISNFFTDTKTIVESNDDDTKSGNKFTETILKWLGIGKDFAKDLKESLTQIVNWIKETLSGLSFRDILEGGFFGSMAYLFIKVGKLADAFSMAGTGIRYLIDGIRNLITPLKQAFVALRTALSMMSFASVISLIALSFMGIAISIKILGSINEADLDRGIAAMEVITSVMIVFLLILMRIRKSEEKIAEERTKQLMTRRSMGEIAMTIFSVAATVYAIGKAITGFMNALATLTEMVDKYESGKIVGAALITAGIMTVLVLIAALMVAASKNIAKKIKATNTTATQAYAETKVLGYLLIGIGAVMAGIGIGLNQIVKSVIAIAETKSDLWPAFGIVMGIIIAMCLGTAAVLWASKDIKPESLGVVAVLMLELFVGMAVLFAAIAGLAFIFTLEEFAGIKSNIERAMNVVVTIMLTFALAIFIIGVAVKTVTLASGNTADISAKLFTKVIGLTILLIAAIFAGLILFAHELGKDTMSSEALSAMVESVKMIQTILIAFAVAMTIIVSQIKGIVDAIRDTSGISKVTNLIYSIGISMLMILAGIAGIVAAVGHFNISEGALMIVGSTMILAMGIFALIIRSFANNYDETQAETMNKVADALIKMTIPIIVIAGALAVLAAIGENLGTDGFTKLSVMLVIVLALIAIMGAITQKMNKIGNKIQTKLIGFAVGLIAIAAAVTILAVAANMMKGIETGDILNLLLLLAGFTLIVVGFAALVGMFEPIKKGFEAIGKVLLGIAGAFLIFGVGLIAAGAGMNLIAPAMLKFAEAFEELAKTLEKHKGVAIGIGVLILAVILLIGITLFKTLPIIDKIVTAISTAITTIAKGIGALGKAIKDGLTTFSTDTAFHRTIKKSIAVLFVSAISAITESGPAVLQKVGQIVLDIIDWLIIAIPAVADKIIELILSLFWGILDGLTNHINEIEAAIGSFFKTLGAIIMKMIMDLWADIIEGSGWFGEGWAAFLGFDSVEAYANDIRQTGQAVALNAKIEAKEARAAAKERDKELQEAAKSYDETVKKVIKSDQEMTEEMKKAENARQKAYDSYIKRQGIDLNKQFLYATRVTNATEQEKKELVNAQTGFVDAAGHLYRIQSGYLKDLENNPTIVASYEYLYQKGMEEDTASAKKSISETSKKSAEEVNEASTGSFLSALTGGSDDDSLGGKVSGFISDKVGSLTNGLTDGVSGALGDSINMDELTNSLVPTNGAEATAEGYDLGYDIGSSEIDGTNDALYDGVPKLITKQESMGDEAASAYTDSYSASMVSSSNKKQVEKSADAVVETQTDRIKDKENQKLYNDAANTSINTFTDQFEYTGVGKGMAASRYLIEGLKIPLEQFAGRAISDPNTAAYYMNNICSSMVDTINSYFAINSPSKRMAQIGGYIVQGLTNGIYDEEGNAISSMANLSDTMFNSFTSPLDYIAKVASGEYQYDPSIRPVLDTTNIRNGATGINSMFDHQNVTLNGLSGSLAADIGQLDGSNMEIIRELRSLRSDLTEVGDKIAGMQVVMDSGRLVGAIAPDMDRALGNRISSNYRGKGN